MNFSKLMAQMLIAGSALMLLSCGAALRIGGDIVPGDTQPKDFTLLENSAVANKVEIAKETGRVAWFDVSGAWCPPCQVFANAKKNGDDSMTAADFAQQTAEVDFFEIEEMYTTYAGMHTYFPVPVLAYPTFVLYDPKGDRWEFFFGLGNLKQTADMIRLFQEGGSFGLTQWELIKGQLSRGEAIDSRVDAWSVFLNIAQQFGAERTFAELKFLQANSEALAAILPPGYLERLPDFVHDVLFTTGEFTLEDLKAADSAAHEALLKQTRRLHKNLFVSPLAREIREKGTFEAARTCRELQINFNAAFPTTLVTLTIPESASVEEKDKIEKTNLEQLKISERFKITRDLMCDVLDVQSGVVPKERLAEKIRQFDLESVVTKSHPVGRSFLRRVFVSAGDFTTAVDFTAQAKEFVNNRNQKDIADLNQKLGELGTQLSAAASEKEKEEIQSQISTTEDRLKVTQLYTRSTNAAYDELISAYVLSESPEAFLQKPAR